MITDIFARRYANIELRTQYFNEDQVLCYQLWKMLSSGLLWDSFETDKVSDMAEAEFKAIHDLLALELGVEFLSDRFWSGIHTAGGNQHSFTHTNTYAMICKNFVTKKPSDVAHGDAWMKERLSLVELAFARRVRQLSEANCYLPIATAKAAREPKLKSSVGIRLPGSRTDALKAINTRQNTSFGALTKDLNERLRLAQYSLTYHNGLIQLSDDQLIDAQIEQPFWALVRYFPWENVDRQMKEAIDSRDTGDRMGAFHAVSALESCIKIVSDTKGWTKSTERGAANFITNLVSKQNGSFLEPWEGELLTKLFSDVRNPFAHGAGQAAMPNLTAEQTNWTIETSMTWIKTLVRRV